MLDMLSGFSISVGFFTIALLAMHGAIYLYLKTEGELQQRLFTWMKGTYYLYLALFVVVTLWSVLFVPASLQHFGEYPIL
jgi:cytochrome d ubiquinol oxidase subunit II